MSKKSCPICTKPTSDKYFPFCSKRCADVDLNRWLKGSYALPAEESYDGKIAVGNMSNDRLDNKNDG